MHISSERSSTGLVSVGRELRTGVWHGESPVHLEFPARWKVTVHWPTTPPPLSDGQIVEILERPVGQPPIRELCQGKKRPLILIDDLNRPTPTGRIIPFVLKEFQAAGISPANVTILVARGSHGEPHPDSMPLKVGREAGSSCRVLLHNPYKDTLHIGKTSFGTDVELNRHVIAADFVVGIGGVYPNNSAGFGGGAKLALGALSIRAITQLHSKHKAVGWAYAGPGNTFRQDVEEIARSIGLETLLVAHVDSDRELVRLRCGDYHRYYDEEIKFAREAFRAPKPGDADVVIANAFPSDLSLTFVHMKGVYPLRLAAPASSRIVLAACSEGEGFHGVYPLVHKSPFHEQYSRLRRISRMSPGEISKKIARKLAAKLRAVSAKRSAQPLPLQTPRVQPQHPIWLYRTGTHTDSLPSPVRGIRTVTDWSRLMDIVHEEQSGREDLNVVVYPCAPLQVLE